MAHVLTPHVSALLAPVAAHAHVQDRGTPPVRLVRQAPDYRVTRLALAPAAATPPILTNDAACQHCVVWLNALAGHFQAQVIQARERAQVGAIKGSIGHVEVFRMDGVGISIIERPRPLHNHDTPNPTQHPYTLKCEEPVKRHRSLASCINRSSAAPPATPRRPPGPARRRTPRSAPPTGPRARTGRRARRPSRCAG